MNYNVQYMVVCLYSIVRPYIYTCVCFHGDFSVSVRIQSVNKTSKPSLALVCVHMSVNCSV